MCKGHFDAWKDRTQRRLEERMQELELKLPTSNNGHEAEAEESSP
jgi:hypothetical protein